MPRNASPRKAYRPRPINAPITAGLVDMFTDCLMTAETGLHLRADTTDHHDAIAVVLNVIGPVALRRFGSRSPDAIAIQSAALAMNAAADRAAAGGHREGREALRPAAQAQRRAAARALLARRGRMYDHELAAVTRGIEAAKAALPYLDVRSLAEQHRLVLRRSAFERAHNANHQGVTQ